jgi:hypothetical protein
MSPYTTHGSESVNVKVVSSSTCSSIVLRAALLVIHLYDRFHCLVQQFSHNCTTVRIISHLIHIFTHLFYELGMGFEV